jgi:murein DD-endopeptidase MepM/ murein hydrolase activator NlpD
MLKYFYFPIFTIFILISCTTFGPYYIDNPYGSKVIYGEGRHPGIDFGTPKGTPVISVSDGEVIGIAEADPYASYGGGLILKLSHGDHFDSMYVHLSEIFVEKGQLVKRGQLIGLSGVSNSGWEHLHFGICKKGGGCKYYSQTYDPEKFWMGGQPQCFDLTTDYSDYSQEYITLPLACGDYAKQLIYDNKK